MRGGVEEVVVGLLERREHDHLRGAADDARPVTPVCWDDASLPRAGVRVCAGADASEGSRERTDSFIFATPKRVMPRIIPAAAESEHPSPGADVAG